MIIPDIVNNTYVIELDVHIAVWSMVHASIDIVTSGIANTLQPYVLSRSKIVISNNMLHAIFSNNEDYFAANTAIYKLAIEYNYVYHHIETGNSFKCEHDELWLLVELIKANSKLNEDVYFETLGVRTKTSVDKFLTLNTDVNNVNNYRYCLASLKQETAYNAARLKLLTDGKKLLQAARDLHNGIQVYGSVEGV